MNTTMTMRRILVFTVAFLVLCFWNAQSKITPLSGDAVCFVPVAQSLIRGIGLVNELYHAPAPLDPLHPERYIWHGPVAPVLWAVFARSDDIGSVREAGVLISAFGFLCFGLLLLRATQNLRWQYSSLLVVAGMLGTSGYFAHTGRPESVACSILCLGLLILPKQDSNAWPIVSGCCLGLMAATAPSSALLLVPIVCAYQVFCSPSIGMLCGRIALIGAITVGTMVTVVVVVGVDPFLWLAAMKAHSAKVMWGRTDGELVTYWIKHGTLPFLALSVMAQLACSLLAGHFWLRGQNGSPISPFHLTTLVLCALAAVWAVWSMALKCPPTHYNLLPLITFLAFAAIYGASKTKAVLLPLLYLGFSPGVLGLSRTVAVWNVGKDHVMTRSEACARLIADLDKIRARMEIVSINSGLFELAADNQISALKPHLETRYFAATNVMVIPQTNSGLLTPPSVEKFRLVVNRFKQKLPCLFGLRLSNTPGGYNYAIYIRDSSFK